MGLDSVSVTRGVNVLLDQVSLGVFPGQRIGVVGRNGAGKTTLVDLLAGRVAPDTGRVSPARDLATGLLGQGEELPGGARVVDVVARGAAEHVWRGDPLTRDVLAGLELESLLERTVASLSGGERRRVGLAAVLTADPRPDLLLLDEPTNHLDVAAVAWLAGHLAGAPGAAASGAGGAAPGRAGRGLVVVTHDRWFLDEVATTVWEVADGTVHSYQGGYSAYVLARAERGRRADAEQARRANLVRKELAWLRRGAPARSRKPRYRVEAATALIADEPPPRDSVALQRFAAGRLGRTVLEVEDASVRLGSRPLLAHTTWRLGPGQRVGLVGVNGAGKSTLLRVLAGEQALAAGRVVRGVTVRIGYLTQDGTDLPGEMRAIEAVEQVARVMQVGREEVSAGTLLERFGLPAARQWTPVADLSGGERRRLQLLRVLMGGANVLLLDEPTNDLDVDTLLALEDVLDAWGGSLVVVSHDRWFIERVSDTVVWLPGDGTLSDLPGGVEQFLANVATGAPGGALPVPAAGAAATTRREPQRVSDRRARTKELARLERAVARLTEREAALHSELATHAADYLAVSELDRTLGEVTRERIAAEEAWLALAGELEDDG